MDDTVSVHSIVDPEAGDLGRFALVVLGCRHDPRRIGEIAFLPAPGQRPIVLGRGGDLQWARQRPGTLQSTGLLEDPHLSRRQLVFSATERGVHAENVGRLALRLNGQPASAFPLADRDLVQIGEQVLLLVTRRTRGWTGTVEPGHRFGEPDPIGWVGESPVAWALREQLQFIARRDQHVLVVGESGTGKEIVAGGLHAYGRRAQRPLVSRNAATIPASLADAELFGNLGGYPNPGMPARPGLVGEADGGTLFLDEFGELPPDQQARLLRVLDSGEYSRLGEAKPRRADLRLIAATNRDPAALKHDVLARFPLRLHVPALHQRVEDIPLLTMHLLRTVIQQDKEIATRICDDDGQPRVSLRLLRFLVEHRYTTHVRELRSLLWRSIGATYDGAALDVPPVEAAAAQATTETAADPMSLDPALIQAVLDRHDGRQEPTWRELGLASRHVLTRLVRKHGLVVRGRR